MGAMQGGRGVMEMNKQPAPGARSFARMRNFGNDHGCGSGRGTSSAIRLAARAGLRNGGSFGRYRTTSPCHHAHDAGAAQPRAHAGHADIKAQLSRTAEPAIQARTARAPGRKRSRQPSGPPALEQHNRKSPPADPGTTRRRPAGPTAGRGSA